MDSVSQLVLGSAVSIAALGARTPVWKAALVGAVCGTLPDLDVFIDHGDPILNMTLHRAESHALFWLTLAALPIGALAGRLMGQPQRWRAWCVAVWLALVTHPLLDVMTVYGTQLALPFSNHPYGVGSVFIIDPLYTLPLIVGVAVALRRGAPSGLAWNAAGLALSTVYLGWGVAAQQMVKAVADVSLRAAGVPVQQVLVTPTAFNSVLWRVVAITPNGFLEGFYSLLDDGHQIAFQRFARGEALYAQWQGDPGVQAIARFSKGCYKMSEREGQVLITDLRMGQEPDYIFSFAVGRQAGDTVEASAPQLVGGRGDVQAGLRWTWRRMLGDKIPSPAAQAR
jgi:inner membrane protein